MISNYVASVVFYGLTNVGGDLAVSASFVDEAGTLRPFTLTIDSNNPTSSVPVTPFTSIDRVTGKRSSIFEVYEQHNPVHFRLGINNQFFEGVPVSGIPIGLPYHLTVPIPDPLPLPGSTNLAMPPKPPLPTTARLPNRPAQAR